MRQNTCLIAFGIDFRGFSDSPAATPTSSVPWKEKPATRSTLTVPASPPTNGASPTKKFVSPGEGSSLMPIMRDTPRNTATPTAMNTMTATTLMSANQNSLSPNPFAEIAFSPNMSARNTALQMIPGVSGSQNFITMPAADSSDAIVTAQLYQ